jgi:hypothetical protein
MVTASAVLFQASCGLNRPPISTKTLLGHLYRGGVSRDPSPRPPDFRWI